jgi:nicotinate-nucleotide pyrophosphorylase (carboxylating)
VGVFPGDPPPQVRAALSEDVGRGDVTSGVTVRESVLAAGHFVTREEVCVSGLWLARAVFHEAGSGLDFSELAAEGEVVSPETEIARVEGPARQILAAERVTLNFLMCLCGIATMARRYVRSVEGTGVRITDTRKTTPGLRALEKAAVRAGGGVNHRAGLDDGILIKDNHVALAGSLEKAVRRAKTGAPHLMKVEVEVESGEQLREALEAGADVVLLDNTSPEEAAELVGLARSESPQVLVEVSGNVSLDNIRSYAEAGPDLISCGGLTHSAPAADVSLELEEVTG